MPGLWLAYPLSLAVVAIVKPGVAGIIADVAEIVAGVAVVAACVAMRRGL